MFCSVADWLRRGRRVRRHDSTQGQGRRHRKGSRREIRRARRGHRLHRARHSAQLHRFPDCRCHGASRRMAAPPLAGVNAPQFYTADGQASPARDVQDLVKQIGEAVVQVRTPERPRFRLFHQRRRLSHDELPRHRGRDGNFRGGVSSDATASLSATSTSRSASSPSTNFKISRCCTSRTGTRRSSNSSRSAARTC